MIFLCDGSLGGRHGHGRGHRGPPVPDPSPPPPAHPVGQELVPITQSELHRNVVCT
jgi:hypothetical protein